MPIFDLPNPGRYRLEHQPLVLALVQINYPILGHLQTLEGITPLQDAIRSLFPYMQMVQVDQLAFVVGPAGSTSAPAQRTIGWRFTDDHAWTLSVNPGVTQLTIGREYTAMGDMIERLRTVLEALANVAGVTRCDRLGVRYIDFAQMAPGEDSGWRDWFREEIVGWIRLDFFGEGVQIQSNLQQTVLFSQTAEGFNGPVQAVIRNGLVPPGTAMPKPDGSQEILQSHAYVIDQDLFVDTPQPMNVDSLTNQFRSMHADIDRFFRRCLSPEGERHFGLVQL